MIINEMDTSCPLPQNLPRLPFKVTQFYFISFFLVALFYLFFNFFSFFHLFFISWRLITLQYCSGFCHTLTWTSHGFTCIPHPDPPSHLPLHPIPLGLPSAPGLSTCLMHPAWAGDLFHQQWTLLQWTLGCNEYLFQIWFPWCVFPEVGLLGHMAVLYPVF